MTITIITTGGTIDKIYFDDLSEFQVGDPQIGTVLKEANVSTPYRIFPLMRKDSLDLTDEDRGRIRDAVIAEPNRRIVITHGTDTMVETAKVLRNISGKVVVLTGAMQPARFRMTDAIFNIASAITAVQLLDPGVYIAMNGCIFDADKVRKNRRKNRFEPIEAS
ncbi:MAG: asparaginase domain-containing protein [Desulfobacterales bacterium]